MPNLFTHPPRLPLVAPSILSADFANLADDCRLVLTGDGGVGGVGGRGEGADLLHIDVMDGHFVPNLTMGPALVASLRRALPTAFLDVHVMVTDPQQYLEPFARAGANHLTFHIEPALDRRAGTGLSPLSQGYDPADLARRVRQAGLSAGLAINPPTPIEAILDLIPEFDLVLIMSVNPGFSGQSFIPETLEKTRIVRSRLRPDQRLQMDGGIGVNNASAVKSAGCDILVAASAIFDQPRLEWGAIVRRLGSPT